MDELLCKLTAHTRRKGVEKQVGTLVGGNLEVLDFVSALKRENGFLFFSFFGVSRQESNWKVFCVGFCAKGCLVVYIVLV